MTRTPTVPAHGVVADHATKYSTTTPSRMLPKGQYLGVKSRLVALPIFRRVIFVDWHGVLSTHSFWWSILNSARHPYRRLVGAKVATLFSDGQRVQEWMRGRYDSPSLVDELGTEMPGTAKEDYLLRVLYRDCRRMPIDDQLVKRLSEVRQSSFVVIATDNMDCFFVEALRRVDLSKHFDDILCSSELGVLKSDNATSFFGEWLDDHDLTFADAVLIDDNRKNCVEFEHKGGVAIQYSSIADLTKLDAWLSTRQ